MGDSLEPLRSHAVFEFANGLSVLSGIERDLIQLTEFLAVIAGRLAMPFGLEVLSEHPTADLALLNRLLGLAPKHIARVDTYQQFRALENNGFKDLAAIHLRGDHPKLFRHFSGCLAREAAPGEYLPSLIRVSDRSEHLATPRKTIRLITNQTRRNISRSGRPVDPAMVDDSAAVLRKAIDSVQLNQHFTCPFAGRLCGKLSPDAEHLVESLLHVFAALRTRLDPCPTDRTKITRADYAGVRTLLIHLPLIPEDRRVSPRAIELAESVYNQLRATGHQLSLPGRSAEGSEWFTRQDVRNWHHVGYNTAKKRLQELEDDGLLLSTVAKNNRDHGKQIHFQFAKGRKPPFRWTNPFDHLPVLMEELHIADHHE